MQARQVRSVSYEEYVALDEAAAPGVKLELFDGVVYCNGQPLDPDHPEHAVDMAGGTPRHNQICANVITALNVRVPEGCSVWTSDQRARFESGRRYGYPDAVVACDPTFDGVVLLNPQLVVEVLSEGTAEHDLVTKKLAYQRWPSVVEVWFVAQHRALVMQHVRLVLEGRERWVEANYEGADAAVESPHFGLQIPVRELYRRV